METIAPNYQSGSLESSINQIKQPMQLYFGQLIGSVTYDDGTHTLTVIHRNGATETYVIDVSSGTVEAAVKDGAGNVITETYETKHYVNTNCATKTELNSAVASLSSWCDEYDSGYPDLNKLIASNWDNYTTGSTDGNENYIVPHTHEVLDTDNIILSIDKSATKAQCEAFYNAMIVPVGIDPDSSETIIVKELGTVPSIDIPVTVMRV